LAARKPILAAFTLTALSWAQNGPAFHAKTELVIVSCAVVNAKGVFVDQLTRDQFEVYDNGVRRTIEHFGIDVDLPLTIGVVVDGSESQKDQIDEHKQTAAAMLEKLFRPGDRVFVISVDQDIRLWTDLTDDVGTIRRQFAGPPGDLFGEPCAGRSSIPRSSPISECGSSRLWDAIYDAAKTKLSAIHGNKVLLVLTDGFDSGSSHSWRQAAEALQQADSSMYAVQYRSAFGRNYAPDLYRLISDTGGTLFRPPEGAYEQIASRIDADFRRRYVLGFRPEKLTGRNRHEVVVDVLRPDLTIRARTRKTYFEGTLESPSR